MQNPLLHKRISIRNASCEIHLILVVLELILKGKIEVDRAFFDSILIVLLFPYIPYIDPCWFPVLFGLNRPHIRLHASLEQGQLLFEPVNVQPDQLFDLRPY